MAASWLSGALLYLLCHFTVGFRCPALGEKGEGVRGLEERRWLLVSLAGRGRDGEAVGIRPRVGPGWAQDRDHPSLREIAAFIEAPLRPQALLCTASWWAVYMSTSHPAVASDPALSGFLSLSSDGLWCKHTEYLQSP